MTQGQSITDTLLYDAFGETVGESTPSATPYKFVGGKGYQSDGDTNLQLLGYRYYNPMIGRFLSSDPIQSGDNWYAYCGNDPLGKADPSGEAFRPGGGGDVGGPGDQYDNTPVGDDLHTTVSEVPAGTNSEAGGSATGDIGSGATEDSDTGGATVQEVSHADPPKKRNFVQEFVKFVGDELKGGWQGDPPNFAPIGSVGPERSTSEQIKDINQHPEKWKMEKSETVPSVSRQNKGGTSKQELFRNKDTGEELTRHTLTNSEGKTIDQYYRPQWKN